MVDRDPREMEPAAGTPAGEAVGRVNLKPPPEPGTQGGGGGPERQVTLRDVLLGVGAIVIIVVGFIMILQGFYQLTPAA
ncbi:MAG: hypothetical protein ACRD1H_12160 [Vicinamibacterales bacterium]